MRFTIGLRRKSERASLQEYSGLEEVAGRSGNCSPSLGYWWFMIDYQFGSFSSVRGHDHCDGGGFEDGNFVHERLVNLGKLALGLRLQLSQTGWPSAHCHIRTCKYLGGVKLMLMHHISIIPFKEEQLPSITFITKFFIIITIMFVISPSLSLTP